MSRIAVELSFDPAFRPTSGWEIWSDPIASESGVVRPSEVWHRSTPRGWHRVATATHASVTVVRLRAVGHRSVAVLQEATLREPLAEAWFAPPRTPSGYDDAFSAEPFALVLVTVKSYETAAS